MLSVQKNSSFAVARTETTPYWWTVRPSLLGSNSIRFVRVHVFFKKLKTWTSAEYFLKVSDFE